MKRALIALITALPLAVGVAAAQGATTDFPGFPGDSGMGTPQVAVAGTVVSVNATAGTFVANAYVMPGFGGAGDFGGAGGYGDDVMSRDMTAPATTQVTISTNTSTMIHVEGIEGPAPLSDLVPGARFVALFPGSPTATLQTIVGTAATSIFAQIPKQFYAFVGTVTGTDTTAGTVTVTVTRSLPSTLVAGGASATFTVSSDTFIIGGSSLTGSGFGGLFGGSLAGVSTGDLVAGGLIGPAGLTATQVEAMPLRFLLDLPAPPTTGAGTTSATSNALREALRLLHGGKVKLGKSHGKSHKSHKAKHTARH